MKILLVEDEELAVRKLPGQCRQHSAGVFDQYPCGRIKGKAATQIVQKKVSYQIHK